MKIRGIVLDWDGVWTDGRKQPDGHSTFSEHDTMGLNLLRFGHYLHTGELLRVAVVTGERNPTAEHVVRREHYDQLFFYARDKTKAIPRLEAAWGIPASEWAFLFDDVLDFGLAKHVGHRAMVAWPATREVQKIAADQGLVDEWLDPSGPIRQWCERYLTEAGLLQRAVAERQAWSETYQKYWAERNAQESEVRDLSV